MTLEKKGFKIFFLQFLNKFYIPLIIVIAN